MADTSGISDRPDWLASGEIARNEKGNRHGPFPNRL